MAGKQKLKVFQTASVSKYVGEIEVPDGLSREDLGALLENFAFHHENAMGRLCHHCEDRVGDVGDPTVEAWDEDGNIVYEELP